MLISRSICFIKTPISIGIFLLLQTIISTVILAKTITSSWIAIIIFLILIGGLLILFIYIRRIASNEKFKPNFKIILIMFIIIIPLEEIIREIQINDKQSNNVNLEAITLSKIYNKKTTIITSLIFLYLLLAIISITIIIKIYKGPLRAK